MEVVRLYTATYWIRIAVSVLLPGIIEIPAKEGKAATSAYRVSVVVHVQDEVLAHDREANEANVSTFYP